MDHICRSPLAVPFVVPFLTGNFAERLIHPRFPGGGASTPVTGFMRLSFATSVWRLIRKKIMQVTNHIMLNVDM
jgi:hypothetical protein